MADMHKLEVVRILDDILGFDIPKPCHFDTVPLGWIFMYL